MKLLAIGLVFCCALMGQAAGVANSSRSNIKNNLTISQDKNGKTVCTVSGKACTKDHLEQLNQALAASNARGGHATEKGDNRLALTRVTLAPDGSLVCEIKNGKSGPCTSAHVGALNSAVAEMAPSAAAPMKAGAK